MVSEIYLASSITLAFVLMLLFPVYTLFYILHKGLFHLFSSGTIQQLAFLLNQVMKRQLPKTSTVLPERQVIS